MSQHEDREKVLQAFGGKKGLIDSGIPAVIFLVVFNLADALRPALISAIAVSALLTLIRLARRETVQHAMSGFIGIRRGIGPQRRVALICLQINRVKRGNLHL